MLWRLRNTVMRFMAGRYGNDNLNRFLTVLYLLLWLVGWFVRGVAARVIYLLTLLLIALVFYRMLSRNIVKRQIENEKYLRFKEEVLRNQWFRHQWDRIRYLGRYRFRRCPGCSAWLRLPIRRGRRTVTCARCHTRFPAFFL